MLLLSKWGVALWNDIRGRERAGKQIAAGHRRQLITEGATGHALY
jgi:hypothetical protein